jgi:hypothetical protein
MRMNLLLLLLLLGLALTSQARACSQCMCGTPFPADALGGVVPMQVRYGFEDRYLSKSNGLDEGPGTEREQEHRVAGFVLWRAADRLALLGRLPYNVKQIRESPLGEESTTQRASGFGDAEVSALVGLAHINHGYPAVFGLVLGVTAPTGSNVKHDDAGQRLDAHLQPGTGAWSGTGGLNIAVTIGSGILDASALGRVNGTNAQGYRYGDTFLYNAGFTSNVWHATRLLAQVNGRVAGRDRLEDGTIGANTGGAVTYLSPGFRWSGVPGLDVEGALQFPVAPSLHGDQTEHTTARLAISMSR